MKKTCASHHARRICILNCCKLVHLTQTWATRLLQWPCGWTPGLQQRCLPTQLRCSFASFRHAMKVQCNSGDYSMLLKTLTSSWSSKLVYQTHTRTLDMRWYEHICRESCLDACHQFPWQRHATARVEQWCGCRWGAMTYGSLCSQEFRAASLQTQLPWF